jgi:hypothetical protein
VTINQLRALKPGSKVRTIGFALYDGLFNGEIVTVYKHSEAFNINTMKTEPAIVTEQLSTRRAGERTRPRLLLAHNIEHI